MYSGNEIALTRLAFVSGFIEARRRLTTRCALALAVALYGVDADAAQRPVDAPFAPGVIATGATEISLSLSPDARTAYFVRTDFAERDNVIMQAIFSAHGHWQSPTVAEFSGVWRDSEPAVTPDGKYIYFSSNRPLHATDPAPSMKVQGMQYAGSQLWRVPKQSLDVPLNGWGKPELVSFGGRAPGSEAPSNYNPSVSRDGTLYFSSKRSDSGTGYQLYRASSVQGQFGAIERLDLGDVSHSRMDPAVDPEQRFLLYASNEGDSFGSADIYLRIRQTDGSFGVPIHLAAPVNTPFLEHATGIGRAFGEIFVTSARMSEIRYPKTQKTTEAAQTQALARPGNGARDVWRFDISAQLCALGVKDATCVAHTPP